MKTKIIAFLLALSLYPTFSHADTRENQLPYVTTLTGSDGLRVLAGGAYTSRNITVANFASVIAGLLFGTTVTPWASITASVDIEAWGNHHGLMVHTSGTQGGAIIGYSQSGAVAGKFYQDTSAASMALWVGRDTLGLGTITTGSSPLFGGAQASYIQMPLIDFTDGSAEFKVDWNGAVSTTGSLTTGGSITNGSGGTPQLLVVSGTAAVAFPTLATQATTTKTVTVTGASATNTPDVRIGLSGTMPAGVVIQSAWVSGANTVSMLLQNLGTGTSGTSTVTVRATVTQY